MNNKLQTHSLLNGGQILWTADIVAVDTARRLLAVWAVAFSIDAVCLNVQYLLSGDDVVDRKVWKFEWNGIDGWNTSRLDITRKVYTALHSFTARNVRMNPSLSGVDSL